jgi:PASTA domain-containing protein
MKKFGVIKEMRILLGTLLGYSLRQRERLLITILTIVLITIYIVLPALSLATQAIALTYLGLSVHRERLARPKQTRVPAIKGLDYQSAVTTLRDSHLNIRVLATRYDLPQQPGTIVDQSPAPGEQVDYNYAVGVTITDTNPRGTSPKDKKCSRDGFTPRTSK